MDNLNIQTPSSIESPNNYKYISSLIGFKITNWNNFITDLDIDKNIKDKYYIKGFIGSVIDNIS